MRRARIWAALLLIATTVMMMLLFGVTVEVVAKRESGRLNRSLELTWGEGWV